MASCRYFPKGTVHVAVVDPGVGSRRQAIAVQTANFFFVGPDNGVLSWALVHEKIKTIRLLENRKYFLAPVSRTFHGRDIFAPAAAHLSRGLSAQHLGRELTDFVSLPWPQPVKRRGEARGEVIYIDRFGNAMTNIEAPLISRKGTGMCEFTGKRKVCCPLMEFYGAVPVNRPVAVLGSSGCLELRSTEVQRHTSSD